MKVIIDIPDEEYEMMRIVDKNGWGSYITRYILDGTPLPKGHGPLIDADKLLKEARDIMVPVYPNGYEYRCCCVPVDSIYDAHAIIEADKEESEE